MAVGMTWTFDVPAGVAKNHALSEEYFKQAIAKTRFFEHVSIKPAFGKKMGESVTIPLVPALTEPSSAQLSENSNIPELPFNYKVQTVIVREFGQAVPYSGLLEELDHYDPEDWISQRLVDLSHGRGRRFVNAIEDHSALNPGVVRRTVRFHRRNQDATTSQITERFAQFRTQVLQLHSK